eukprot:COSAG05_NODE_444_length_9777_cov_20.852965_7_plen_102_part_00
MATFDWVSGYCTKEEWTDFNLLIARASLFPGSAGEGHWEKFDESLAVQPGDFGRFMDPSRFTHIRTHSKWAFADVSQWMAMTRNWQEYNGGGAEDGDDLYD